MYAKFWGEKKSTLVPILVTQAARPGQVAGQTPVTFLPWPSVPDEANIIPISLSREMDGPQHSAQG